MKNKVDFKNDTWDYPANQIEQHLVSEYPKVMWVGNHPEDKGNRQRVVFLKKNDKYIAWFAAETLEEVEREVYTSTWDYAWDVEEEREMPQPQETFEDKVLSYLDAINGSV